MMLDYTHVVDPVKPPRDRRARQAAATRARIIEAAGRLFAERGYGATTIDAVATEADVAVETVYARFKNKRNLLEAYLDTSIVGDAERVGKVMGKKVELEFAPPRPGELFRSSLDIGKAKRVLGWAPAHGFDDGLPELVEWFKKEAR